MQGAQTEKKFLTDPVISSENILRSGRTNVGGKFMEKCKDSNMGGADLWAKDAFVPK